jgi:hypothetical protein
MTLTFNFESGNSDMNSAFQEMEDMLTMSMIINGEEFAYEMYGMKMVYVDDTYYVDYGDDLKYKAEITEDIKEDFLKENNPAAESDMDLGYADFVTVTMEKVDGKYVVTCSEIKEESLDTLSELASDLGFDGASVEISNVEFVIVYANNKCESGTLSCDYQISMSGISISFSMIAEYEINYDIDAPAAPADASTYEEIDASDLLE